MDNKHVNDSPVDLSRLSDASSADEGRGLLTRCLSDATANKGR